MGESESEREREKRERVEVGVGGCEETCGLSRWRPGIYEEGARPARGADVVASGPHLAFRRDYYQQEPANYVKTKKVGVRPYRGVNGLRPEQQPGWEVKQPQKPGP